MVLAFHEHSAEVLQVTCPVCDHDNRGEPTLAYAQEPWHLKQCKRCEMVYLENPPAPAALEKDLAWEKTFAEESSKRRRRSPALYAMGRAPKAALQHLFKRNKLLALLEKTVEPGPILDIGCAGGHTLAALPGCYVPHGIEISHEMSALAAKQFVPRGGSVLQADALSGLARLPQAHFTGVIMTSFLEHDVNAKATLAAARGVMAKDARLIIKVPNYNSFNRLARGRSWCGFRFPDHVHYFTPKSLRMFLESAGFKIVRFGFFDRLVTSDTMWLVAKDDSTKQFVRSSRAA